MNNKPILGQRNICFVDEKTVDNVDNFVNNFEIQGFELWGNYLSNIGEAL